MQQKQIAGVGGLSWTDKQHLLSVLKNISSEKFDLSRYPRGAALVFSSFGGLLAKNLLSVYLVTPRTYYETLTQTIKDILNPGSSLWSDSVFDCASVSDFVSGQAVVDANPTRLSFLEKFFTHEALYPLSDQDFIKFVGQLYSLDQAGKANAISAQATNLTFSSWSPPKKQAADPYAEIRVHRWDMGYHNMGYGKDFFSKD